MADKKDEFLDENVEEKPEEIVEKEETPEKIKVGEEEYTQEELDRLVKLGKIGVEAEDKYDTKIDRIWPDYTTKSQELKELKEQKTKREEEEGRAKLAEGKELSPEEQRKIAREEAGKLGLITDTDFDKRYAMMRAGERLMEDAEDVALDGMEKYGIKTTGREVVEYMAETGIRNPDDAFQLKFKDPIRKWEESELGKKKGEGLVTEQSSTAGAKVPKEQIVTRDNLGEHVAEVLRGGKEE